METIAEGVKSCSIADLLDEVIRKIFSLFSPQELCSQLAPVCSKWHRIARDPNLWRELVLEKSSLMFAVKLFPHAPFEQLRVLKVKEWDVALDALIALVAAHCPDLSTFSHTGSSLTISSKSLLALAASCPNISEFLFQQDTLSDEDYSVFEHFPKLRVLEFTFTIRSVAKDFSQIDLTLLNSTSIIFNEQLETSNAVDSQLFDAYFCRFVLKHRSVLTMLHSENAPLRDDTNTAIASCAQLVSLTLLEATGLTDLGLTAIAENLTRLKYLFFGNGEDEGLLTEAGLISAFTNTDNLTQLSHLCLHRYAVVTDNVVIAIANRFARKLKVLGFSYCTSITEIGLTQVLASCSELEELYLDGVPNLSATFLLTVPKCLTKLRKLSIKDCHIANESVMELRNAMHALSVDDISD